MLLYHFIGHENGLKNIRARHLKISTFDRLNDPFELEAFSLTDKQEQKAFKEWKAYMSKTYGLLCFSASWKSPVQWAHYAERHTGLCLAFETDAGEQVDYVPKREPVVLRKVWKAGQMNQELIQKMLLTKYEHWYYEEEYRVMAPLENRPKIDGMYFEGFGDRLALKAVYVGSKSPVTRAILSDALGDLKDTVRMIPTRPAFKSYTICEQQNRALWK